MSSEQSSGTYSRMRDTSTHVNLETLTPLLRESCGLILAGPAIIRSTKISPNDPTIGTTRIDLCVRNLATDRIMEASLLHSQPNPNSLLAWSKTSSPNTSEPSPPISSGKDGLTLNCVELARLHRLLEESASFGGDVTTTQLYEKLSLMILNAPLPKS